MPAPSFQLGWLQISVRNTWPQLNSSRRCSQWSVPEDVRVVAERKQEAAPVKTSQLVPTLASFAASLAIFFSAQSPSFANIPGGFKRPDKPPTTNPQALLLEAMPVRDPLLSQIAESLTAMTTEGGGNIRSSVSKGLKGLGPELEKSLQQASSVFTSKKAEILKSIPTTNQDIASEILDSMSTDFSDLQRAVNGRVAWDIVNEQENLLEEISRLEALLVDKFPYDIPPEYQDRPQLRGRAVVECKLTYKDLGGVQRQGIMLLAVDGYNAPLTSGNFVDNVLHHRYDSVQFERADELILQSAPPKDSQGPSQLPLEIRVKGEKLPVYEATLSDVGRFRDEPALPFSAYGTVGMAHDADDVNLSESQIFFVKSDPVYNPVGLNILDGNYAVFAYVIKGAEFLDLLQQGDSIQSMRVLYGAEKLVNSTPDTA